VRNILQTYKARFSDSKWACLLLLLFGIVYCVISFVNHYLFRTYTLDLGFYTNALFDYRNFRWNDSSTIFDYQANMLGGHFEPILFLFAPFSFLFGSYTLLVIQIAFLLWAGICIYHYFKDSNKFISLGATTFFLGFFTLFAALAFDFHTNVIAASCLPFLFLSVKKNKLYHLMAVFVLMLLCKENMSLWLFFIFLGLAFEYRKNKVWRNRLLLFSVASMTYFFVVIYGLIPAFSHNGSYGGFLYSIVGNSPHEALTNMVSHPLHSLELLFVNHSGNAHYDYHKIEFHILLLLCGLPLLLLRPAYFFMLIPLYFQKMLHNDPAMWGVGFHYAAEFAPVFSVGIFEVINSFKNEKLKNSVAVLVCILGLGVTFHTMDSTVMFTDKSRIRFYQHMHYAKSYDVKPIYAILDDIPADATLSVQSPFLSHLALRNHIYQFPIIQDAEFVIFSFEELTYPLSEERFISFTNEILENPEWEIWRKQGDFYVLKKRP